jgi:hypothetical protein
MASVEELDLEAERDGWGSPEGGQEHTILILLLRDPIIGVFL